ncbi:putative portal protein [Podila epicladia]|nr:putative portal protein [Podila epicladia]
MTRWGALKNERSSWMARWKNLSDHLLPFSGRYLVEDRNRGERRANAIYDSTGRRAVGVLAAGMMSGMTSPARPWFRLAAADSDLMRSAPVKRWLHQVTQKILDIFQRSNTYLVLHMLYEELAVFGTAASVMMDDHQAVIRHYPLTAGEFCIATNYRGEVDTLYREFQKTVGQIVGEFGIHHVSPTIKNLYDRGSLDQWVTLIHAIEPRTERNIFKRDAQNMAWRSVYFEAGGHTDHVLRESGFAHFPALAPRWAIAIGGIYGNSPGMEALGDVRQLQHEQLRKAESIDYMTRPPLQAPTDFKHREMDFLPGGISYVDAAGSNGGIRSAFAVQLDLSHLLADIEDVRERIKGVFYADLFRMLSNQEKDIRMTATEVAERHEEKLVMLGPVLGLLHNELLAPLVEWTFTRMLTARIMPPPPPEMQGQALNIEFVSMLAQVQRAIGTHSTDRFVASLGSIAQIKPEVLDKFDPDVWADEYADMLGLNPELIVAGDRVALIRQQRAQQQQQAQQMAQFAQGAQIAGQLARSPTSEKNVLTDTLSAFSGYGSTAP